jgi:hypothetical protein
MWAPRSVRHPGLRERPAFPQALRVYTDARVHHTDAAFHDFGAYDRLLVAAQEIDYRSYVIALLGGETGLRAAW